MRNKKYNTIAIGSLIVIVIFLLFRYEYFDTYKLSMNGTVEDIEITVKKTMNIIVSEKKHDLFHYWPLLQIKVEIGDSVYKKSGEYDIVLIKKITGERIVCHKDQE